VAGVGHGEQAAGGDVRGQAGGKAAVGAAHHAVVQRAQHVHGVSAVGGLGADGSHQHGHQHGGGQALAADVAQHYQHAALAVADLLEEVAAYLLGGAVDAIDEEARTLVELIGQKHQLHLAGGLEFAGQPDLLAAGAGKAQDEKDAHGQQKDEMEKNARAHGERRHGNGSIEDAWILDETQLAQDDGHVICNVEA
jgi:hypothetical protein